MPGAGPLQTHWARTLFGLGLITHQECREEARLCGTHPLSNLMHITQLLPFHRGGPSRCCCWTMGPTDSLALSSSLLLNPGGTRLEAAGGLMEHRGLCPDPRAARWRTPQVTVMSSGH